MKNYSPMKGSMPFPDLLVEAFGRYLGFTVLSGKVLEFTQKTNAEAPDVSRRYYSRPAVMRNFIIRLNS